MSSALLCCTLVFVPTAPGLSLPCTTPLHCSTSILLLRLLALLSLPGPLFSLVLVLTPSACPCRGGSGGDYRRGPRNACSGGAVVKVVAAVVKVVAAVIKVGAAVVKVVAAVAKVAAYSRAMITR